MDGLVINKMERQRESWKRWVGAISGMMSRTFQECQEYRLHVIVEADICILICTKKCIAIIPVKSLQPSDLIPRT